MSRNSALLPPRLAPPRAGRPRLGSPRAAGSYRDRVDEITVLLVEDDAALRLTTRLVLEKFGFTVVTATDGLDGLDRLDDGGVDVAVIDVMMPRLDGIGLTKRIRDSVRWRDLPILLLTARDLPHDQVVGLESGADDYVTKPFDGEVLAARLRALIRRRHAEEAEVERLGGLEIDRLGMTLTRDGRAIDLSATEFRLLFTLLDYVGTVLSREQLLSHVWGSADWGDPRVVDVNIQRLRSKIGAEHIVTVRGAGYKLVRP